MTQRTLGLILALLAGVAIGLAFIGLHFAWLSLYYAKPKLLVGCIARELVWLNLPLAAALLGLLSVRSQRMVAPLVGVIIGTVVGYLAGTWLYPEVPAVPPSKGLSSSPVILGLVAATLIMTTALAHASAWLERRSDLVWLSYTVAAGYAVLLTLAMTYSRRVLPPGGEVHLVVWPFVLAVILSGFFAGALVGQFVAVWAGIFVGEVGQVIFATVMAEQQSNLFPLVLVVVGLSAGFAFPGGYAGEELRKLLLGPRVRAA
jgi:hypothetical protein